MSFQLIRHPGTDAVFFAPVFLWFPRWQYCIPTIYSMPLVKKYHNGIKYAIQAIFDALFMSYIAHYSWPSFFISRTEASGLRILDISSRLT
jgi:hypothetical protein